MGCFVSDTARVFVSTNFPFYVPNVFAPQSSNAENAIFRPFVTDKVERIHSMRVFNRWGEMVYERQDLPTADESVGWDGTFKGEPLDSGFYVFSLEMEFIDGTTEVHSGDVMLIR